MVTRKVLIVDDSEVEFEILKSLFAKNSFHQYKLSWVKTKSEAVSKILSNEYDVHIVDYNLGQDSGIDLIKEVKEKGCGDPFILLTSFGHEAVDREAQALGVDEYIIKEDLSFYTLDKSIRYALERKKTESIFMEQQAKLLKSIKMSMLGELVSGVAHEVNNPISLLSLLLANMKKKALMGKLTGEDAVNLLEKAETTVKRMSKITASLTRYSRNSELDPFERVDFKTLVDEAVEICFGKIRSNRIKIDIGPISKGNYIDCRPGEIIQVLVNIINNAVDEVLKFEDKWIKITSTESVNYFEINIIDSGRGISSELQEKIYTPFFTTKKADGGTGLGLSISKSIIESHSGKMNFGLSEEGNTRVRISIPKDAKSFQPLKRKVLVVDDKKKMRALFATILEEKNCLVYEASDYSEALLKLRKNEDIGKIVLDTDISGFELDNFISIVSQLETYPEIALIGDSLKFAAEIESLNDNVYYTLFQKPFDTAKLIDFCLEDRGQLG